MECQLSLTSSMGRIETLSLKGSIWNVSNMMPTRSLLATTVFESINSSSKVKVGAGASYRSRSCFVSFPIGVPGVYVEYLTWSRYLSEKEFFFCPITCVVNNCDQSFSENRNELEIGFIGDECRKDGIVVLLAQPF